MRVAHGALASRCRETVSAYGAEWRRQRDQVLAEEPFCPGYPRDRHGAELVRTTSVDHIVPLVEGGTSDRANLRGLCGACNSRKGADEARRRRAPARRANGDGRPARVWRQV